MKKGYEADTLYRNRYGVEWQLKTLETGVYLFDFPVKELQYCRYGGKVGETGINMNDLGFIDPSGGPFLSDSDFVEGKKVKSISVIAVDNSTSQIIVKV